MIEQKTIERLIEKYQNYEGSRAFILASVDVFNYMTSSSLKSFIEQTFTNNKIDNCNSVRFHQLSAHWRNVATDKLNAADYGSYMRCMSTSIRFKAIATFLENKSYE
jgi:hypothetical protein